MVHFEPYYQQLAETRVLGRGGRSQPKWYFIQAPSRIHIDNVSVLLAFYLILFFFFAIAYGPAAWCTGEKTIKRTISSLTSFLLRGFSLSCAHERYPWKYNDVETISRTRSRPWDHIRWKIVLDVLMKVSGFYGAVSKESATFQVRWKPHPRAKKHPYGNPWHSCVHNDREMPAHRAMTKSLREEDKKNGRKGGAKRGARGSGSCTNIRPGKPTYAFASPARKPGKEIRLWSWLFLNQCVTRECAAPNEPWIRATRRNTGYAESA